VSARIEQLRVAQEARRDALRQEAAAQADRVPISPLALVGAVAGAVPDEGHHRRRDHLLSLGVRELLRARDHRGFYGLRGGGIGWGLPASLGVKLAPPDRSVIALVGDGSAMYTIQSLWSAAHDSIAVVFVIFNNQSYRIPQAAHPRAEGLLGRGQHLRGDGPGEARPRLRGSRARPGRSGELVEKTADVASALKRGLASGGPYLLDVRIDGNLRG
jgi:benzoylformate decarboxylase